MQDIDQICQIENFYYLSQFDNHFLLETDFFDKNVENKFGERLKNFDKIDAQTKQVPFNMDLRRAISKSIVLQYMRTPWYRKEKAINELCAYLCQIAYLLRSICDFETEEISYTFEGAEYHKNLLFETEKINEISRAISEMNWELLRTTNCEFCTSDNPIVIIERKDMPVKYCDAIEYFTEMFYPLSPHLLLHIEAKHKMSKKHIIQRHIDDNEFTRINRLLKHNSVEYIIYKETLY